MELKLPNFLRFKNRKSFHESISFSAKLCSFFGYLHFPTVKGQVKESKPWVYSKFIFHIFFGYYASIKSSEVSEIDVQGTDSIIIKIAIEIIILVTSYMPTVFRISNFLLRHQQRLIYRDIEIIDKKLIKYANIRLDYNKYFRVFVMMMITYISFLMVAFTVDTELSKRYFEIKDLDPFSVLLALYTVFAFLCYQLHHLYLIYSIKERFEALSQAFLREGSANVQIGRIYNRIHGVLRSVNASYTIGTIYFFGQYMLFTIFFFFIFITTITNPDIDGKGIAYCCIMGFFWSFYSYFGVSIILLASQIRSADDRIRENMNMNIIELKDLRVGNLLNAQLLHEAATVSSGIFIVDWEYLFTLFSCLFSYLIILIQFESS